MCYTIILTSVYMYISIQVYKYWQAPRNKLFKYLNKADIKSQNHKYSIHPI